MRMRHFIRALLLATSISTLAFAVQADMAGAETFCKAEHGKIKQLVDNNAPDTQVRAAIDGMVNYDELARRTMGKPCPASIPNCTNHWDTLNGAQQKEVTGLLQKLVEKNYHKNLNKTRDYEVSYRPSKEAGENITKVRTEAKSKAPEKNREPTVQVDYVIMGNGSTYRVIDIVTEGSSMTKNYYDQFHRMLTTADQGYPYLVQKLKDKIAKNNP